MKGLFFVLMLISLCTQAQEMDTCILTGSRIYTYDDVGNKTGKLTYDTEDELVKQVRYVYDANRNKIRTEKYLADSTQLAVYRYEFDENNFKVRSWKTDFIKNVKTSKRYWNNELCKRQKTEYYKEGVLLKTTHYKYNDKGDVIEAISYDSKGELLNQYTYKYSYPENQILKETYNGDSRLIKLSTYCLDDNSNKIEFSTVYYSVKRKNSKRLYSYNTKGQRVAAKVYVEESITKE